MYHQEGHWVVSQWKKEIFFHLTLQQRHSWANVWKRNDTFGCTWCDLHKPKNLTLCEGNIISVGWWPADFFGFPNFFCISLFVKKQNSNNRTGLKSEIVQNMTPPSHGSMRLRLGQFFLVDYFCNLFLVEAEGKRRAWMLLLATGVHQLGRHAWLTTKFSFFLLNQTENEWKCIAFSVCVCLYFLS